ncbi:MAG: serine/threonine-protein kinase [Gammaproteobacteria bacterium]
MSEVDTTSSRPVGARTPPETRRTRILRDRFEIRERIGEGGVGVLYRAIDRRRREAGMADGAVAVKMPGKAFRTCPEVLRSLQREARNARLLVHPNIRTVYALDRSATDPFITMEWLDGESLARRLDRTGSRGIQWPAACRILSGVAAGLMHAHRQGIVHGDVKPGNVFITVRGQIKLLDFGQAHAVASTRRAGGRRAISPAYASCELHEGAPAEIGDDVFSLAVMAYRILSGVRPFGRYTAPIGERAGVRALRPLGLSEPQWRVLQQGLAWRREHRPPGVAEFVEGLLQRPAVRRSARGLSLHAAA